jgi:hypothetical protein
MQAIPAVKRVRSETSIFSGAGKILDFYNICVCRRSQLMTSEYAGDHSGQEGAFGDVYFQRCREILTSKKLRTFKYAGDHSREEGAFGDVNLQRSRLGKFGGRRALSAETTQPQLRGCAGRDRGCRKDVDSAGQASIVQGKLPRKLKGEPGKGVQAADIGFAIISRTPY